MIRFFKHPLAALAVILALPTALAACGGSVIGGGGSGGGCTVDGQTYAVGESMGAPDDCNSCTCMADGSMACTMMDCMDGCEVDGVFHPYGETFSVDCNSCWCDANGMACTAMECATCHDENGQGYYVGEGFPGPSCTTCVCQADGQIVCEGPGCVGGCDYGGAHYQPGDSFPDLDGCNTCTCMADGGLACTDMACAASCTYAGVDYPPGASFPALDGCNTCTCMADGSLSCTKMACQCQPKAEWWRNYVALDPATCQVIDYVCPANTTGFQNSCGCGCEQDPACPQYFDCMPPSPCDPAQIAIDCPYSGIAY